MQGLHRFSNQPAVGIDPNGLPGLHGTGDAQSPKPCAQTGAGACGTACFEQTAFCNVDTLDIRGFERLGFELQGGSKNRDAAHQILSAVRAGGDFDAALVNSALVLTGDLAGGLV